MKLNYKLYCLAAALLTFSACEEEDAFQNGLNIANMAQMYDSNGDVARAAYKRANGDGTLTAQFATEELTGFLPSDVAFKNAGFINREASEDGDVDALKEIFLYHVVDGALKKEDISAGSLVMLSSKDVAVAVGSNVTLSGLGNQGLTAKVVGTDALVTNGYVHTIDRLLLPAPRTVVNVFEQSGVFNLFETALVRANLKTTLSGTGPFTVFAPTDPAFISMLAIPTKDGTGNTKTRAALETEAKAIINSMDAAELTDLLEYHVLNGNFSSQTLVAGDVITRNGATVKIEKDDKGNLKQITGLANEDEDGDALVSLPLQADVLVTNGYIQVIDRVLLPE